jgi:hypothetical protein
MELTYSQILDISYIKNNYGFSSLYGVYHLVHIMNENYLKIVEMDSDTCKHQPVYFGAVNININERTIGSVDVWRCGVCKKRFCEEKQLGIESITDIVGMPPISHDEKWAVLVSKLQKGKDKWKLVKLNQNGTLKFETVDEKVIDLQVKNYKIEDDNHWSFLIDDNIGKAVEI